MAARSLSDLVEVGYVARAHGLRGELRVMLHNPGSDALTRASALWLAGCRHGLRSARAAKDAWLVQLDDVADRDRAEALKGAAVAVERTALGLQTGEFLLVDLVGCRVFLPDGRPWGEVTGLETGFQDRLVIRDGAIERLLPAVPEFLVEADVTAGRLVVDPPEGLPEYPVE